MISETKEMEDGILIQFQYVINQMKKKIMQLKKERLDIRQKYFSKSIVKM